MKRKFVLSLFVLTYLLAVLVLPTNALACSGVAGDVNDDGSVNVSDQVYLYNWMFLGGPAPPCMAQADVNGDCGVNISDYIYLSNYIWSGGPAPKFC